MADREQGREVLAEIDPKAPHKTLRALAEQVGPAPEDAPFLSKTDVDELSRYVWQVESEVSRLREKAEEDQAETTKYALRTIAERRELSARVEAAEAENARLRVEMEDATPFIAVWAAQWADKHGLPDGHLHPDHYDILKRFGGFMDGFTRAALQGGQSDAE